MFSIAHSEARIARTTSMRRVWLKAHRWAGLGAGWLLALVALAGAILVPAQALDRLAHPHLFVAGDGGGAPGAAAALEPMRARLAAEFGGAAITLRPPRASGETLRAIIRAGAWSGTVYLDPASGREQGRRGEYEGVVNLLFAFHSELLLGDAGKSILAAVALLYLLLLVSGAVLWWPKRWPPALKIALRKGQLRAMFDLHRTGGALLGLLIAVSVATGAYMAWRPLSAFVTTLSGASAVRPPAVAKEEPLSAAAASLDEMVARARARFANAPVGYIHLPAQAGRPVRIRLRLADDPHPNGLTSVWLHPKTGAVLAAHRWDELDPGARAYAVIYPLHTGELGGVVLETAIFVIGVALGMLGMTGIWLWWRRRA